MPLFLNLLLLKQESVYSSLVDIGPTCRLITLTVLAEVIAMFCKCEIKCQTVVCGHWKSKVNGVFIA